MLNAPYRGGLGSSCQRRDKGRASIYAHSCGKKWCTMAEVVKNFEFTSRTNRTSRDWDQWFDGRTWKLTREDMGEAQISTITTQARMRAKKRGFKLNISVNKEQDFVMLQAVEMTDEEKERAEEQLAAQKDREKAKREEKREARKMVETEEQEEAPAPTPKKKGKKSA